MKSNVGTAFKAAAALCILVGLGAASPPTGQVRTYYIAADELDWNYFPTGHDGMMGMMGMAPTGYAKAFNQRTKNLIGSVYRKAIYREYTDATFTKLKPRAPGDKYMGLLGPTIYAEVGDTIHVVFKNRGTHPYSIHAHGVRYVKDHEGSFEGAGPMGGHGSGDSVAPGQTFTYVYDVPERAGPGPNDPSSIVWPYHSHVDERRDVNAGLIGAIVITRAGMALDDGTPKDVDRNFVVLFEIFDENRSWFIDQNTRRFTKIHTLKEKLAATPVDPSGKPDPIIGTGFLNANFRATMNGYSFANMPMPTMKVGQHVRWYVLTIGEGFNQHSPHWHGNTVLFNGNRVDVVELMPAQSLTADMVPDNPGTWMFHCHFSDHMEAGMVSMYQVTP